MRYMIKVIFDRSVVATFLFVTYDAALGAVGECFNSPLAPDTVLELWTIDFDGKAVELVEEI